MPSELAEGKIGAKMSSASAVALFLLCFMYAMTYIDRNNVITAAFIFKKDLNVTNTQVGLVFSAFAYPYLVFQIIGGWVSDRFGPRRSLTLCALIWGTAILPD
jgi:ACS family glucarate transporter-like MFS transporter